MRSFTLDLYTVVLLLLPFVSLAQERSPVKFGKVAPEDFDLSKYKFDSAVSAVVISEIGSSAFQGNTKGWFSLVYKVQKRIKIINKNGFAAADVNIALYSDGKDEEKIQNLKATTYNLENGAVIKTDLDDKAVFKDKLSENYMEKKFTLPAVKEGSIIEYAYTLNSDFLFNLQPWAFQGEYPRIWSEYNVSLPEFFDYVTLSQGYQPFFITSHTNRFENFNIIESGGSSSDNHVSLYTNLTDFRWVMRDVPALKEEAFTSTIRNHIARIEFQLSEYRFPNQPPENIMGNWNTVSDKLLAREDFGLAINGNNNWLHDDTKSIIGNESDPLQKTKLIYQYVRDNFTCTKSSGIFLKGTLKNIFKNKNGSVADINLMLIAMLHDANIEAYPVILSTRSNGFVHFMYPLMSRYNYVITEVRVNEISYFLDASQPSLGFNKLSPESYNGPARRIAPESKPLVFSADSLQERKVTSVIINNEKGKLEGGFQSTLGYIESLDIRKKIKEKGEAEFFKTIGAAYNNEIEIKDPGIDSLAITEKPLTIHYEFKMNDMDQDIIYFNPMMAEGYKTNFFKAADRKYPIEMPSTSSETYVLNMEIPKGYVVDEIPKSVKVSLNEEDGSFEYLVSKTETEIQLLSKISIKRANFAPEEYNSLRDFFGYVVKKHSEQIVFKKKK